MSLKDGIERELGIPTKLRAGAPGSLRVLVDGKEIYSKKQAKHSAGANEIVRLIREVAG